MTREFARALYLLIYAMNLMVLAMNVGALFGLGEIDKLGWIIFECLTLWFFHERLWGRWRNW